MVVAVEIYQQLLESLFCWEKLCPESTQENYHRIKMCISYFVMILVMKASYVASLQHLFC